MREFLNAKTVVIAQPASNAGQIEALQPEVSAPDEQSGGAETQTFRDHLLASVRSGG